MSRDARRFAEEIARLQQDVRSLQTAERIGYSSVEDGSLPVYDEDGTLRQTVGQQDDGTFTTVDSNAPAPVAPAAPDVTGGAGLLTITTYGLTADGSDWLSDFFGIEVHVGLTPGFIPSPASKITSYGRDGGVVSVALDPGTYYVVLVALNTSGTASEPSAEVAAEVTAPATGAGGVNTYESDTAPVGLGAEDEGAIWYDTSRGNLQHRWSGIAWSPLAVGGGALADDAVDGKTIAGALLVDGTVEAERVEVGDHYWSRDEGFVIPLLGGGEIRFPADGSAASLWALLVALGLTVKGDAAFYGLAEIYDRFRMADGISDPTAESTASRGWNRIVSDLASDEIVGPEWVKGMCQSVGNPDEWTVVRQFFGTNFRQINKTTGETNPFIFPDDDRFDPAGITTVGGNYFVLGRDRTTAEWKVYKFDAAYAAIADWTTGVTASFEPAIGTDGTNVLVASTGGSVFVRTYDTAGVLIDGPTKIGDLPEGSDLSSIGHEPTMDFPGPRWVVTTNSGGVFVFTDTQNRKVSEEFPNAGGTQIRGLWWDGTRFFHVDGSGRFWEYNTNPLPGTVYHGYTWFDGEGTTHETATSPPVQFNQPARTLLTVSGNPAPDVDKEDTAGGVNMLVNSGFEEPLGPEWDGAPPAALTRVDDGTAFNGIYYGVLSNPDARPAPNFQSEDTTYSGCAEGDTLTVSAYIRHGGGSSTFEAHIDTRFYDDLGTLLDTDTGTGHLPTTEWVQITNTGVAPAGTAYAKVRVRMTGAAAGDVLHIDAMQLEPGDTATAYTPLNASNFPDKANRLRFYVGLTPETRRLQSPPGGEEIGVTSVTLASITEDAPLAPTVSGFGDADTAAGAIESAAIDLGGAPLTRLDGSGAARLAKFSQSGFTSTGGFPAVDTDVEVDVVFPVPFDSIPRVKCQIIGTHSPVNFYPLVVRNETETGFTVVAARSNGLSSIDIDWEATIAY